MAMTRRAIVDNRHPEGGIPSNDAGWWVQERVHWKDFAAAGAVLTANVDLTGWPSGCLIIAAFIRAGVNFLGGAIATSTLSLGSVGTPTAYVAAVSVFSGSPKTLPGTTIVPGTFILNAAATNPLLPGIIRAQLVTTVANVNVLTQGWADIFILLTGVKITA